MRGHQRDRVYRTEAIILGRMDYSETDRIITLFSRDRGRFRAIAKGVRKPTSKLAPSLEYFMRTRLVLSKGRDLDIITAADAVERHAGLGARVSDLSYCFHMLEVTTWLTREGQELPAVFDLLAGAISEIQEGGDARAVARYFELAILALTGHRLELYRCVDCQGELTAEINYLGGHPGGMICPKCQAQFSGARPVSINAQKFLRTLDRLGLHEAMKLRIPEDLAVEIEGHLVAHIRSVAEHDLSSLQVLREIREVAPPLAI